MLDIKKNNNKSIPLKITYNVSLKAGISQCMSFQYFKCLSMCHYIYTHIDYVYIFYMYYKMYNILYLEIYNDVFGEGNGTPLQYSCLENPMDRGAW